VEENLLAWCVEALAIPLHVIISLFLSSHSSHMMKWARQLRSRRTLLPICLFYACTQQHLQHTLYSVFFYSDASRSRIRCLQYNWAKTNEWKAFTSCFWSQLKNYPFTSGFHFPDLLFSACRSCLTKKNVFKLFYIKPDFPSLHYAFCLTDHPTVCCRSLSCEKSCITFNKACKTQLTKCYLSLSSRICHRSLIASIREFKTFDYVSCQARASDIIWQNPHLSLL